MGRAVDQISQVGIVDISPERQRLLSLVADLIIDNGLHDLSLSGVARAIGSNNRMLLYYFGSRDHLLGEALQVILSRFPKIDGIFGRLQEDADFGIRLERAWDDIGDPENLQLLRVFFQTFGRALYDRAENDVFLAGIRGWGTSLTKVFQAEGYSRALSKRAAIEVIAMWRGLQFALLAGEDHEILTSVYRSSIRSLLARIGDGKSGA